jgi:Ca2+-binding EF-hand superfamily protein
MAAPMNVSTSYFDKNVPKVVLRSLFMKYDADGSGVLNQKELKQLFQGDLGMTKDQAEAYSMLLDKDGSQTVNFEELHQWLTSGEKFKNVNDKSR